MKILKLLLVSLVLGCLVFSVWGLFTLEGRINKLEDRIEDLETGSVHLKMEVGTNRLLIKEMQRKFVPNHVALREAIK